jgi:biotin carboxylase
VPVISQRRECLSVFDDKLLAMRALHGAVELAAFADGTNDAEVDELVRRTGFPVVVKGRRSSGSRTLHVVHSTGELSGALANVALPLVQAYLDDAGGEFSAGIFRSTVFDSTIVFRRKLGPGLGLSWEAEVVDAEEIGRYAENVARLVTAAGSVNVQVRLTDAGPRLLEVNPRFSSLVAARAAAGFEDVDWSLRLALGLPLEPPAPFRRLRFRRFFGEVVDTGNGFGGVPEWLPRCLPASRRDE